MIVRVAALSDAEPVAALVTELGYPSTAEQVRRRLAGLARDRSSLAVVAEIDGAVVGLAAAHVLLGIHTDRLVVYLTALVVAASTQRHGVGRGLVAHVETWARFQKAERIAVVAGAQRIGAHAFYERLGYERTGFRYAKDLDQAR